jgi:hypothetical protein
MNIYSNWKKLLDEYDFILKEYLFNIDLIEHKNIHVLTNMIITIEKFNEDQNNITNLLTRILNNEKMLLNVVSKNFALFCLPRSKYYLY